MPEKTIVWYNFLVTLATLLGLGITGWQVYRTRTAAEAARTAAGAINRRLGEHDASRDCATAIRLIHEMQNYQRQELWYLLPDRYAQLRDLVIQIRGSVGVQGDAEKTELMLVMGQIGKLADAVEKAQYSPPSPEKIAALNNRLGSQCDRLSHVLAEIKRNLGVAND